MIFANPTRCIIVGTEARTMPFLTVAHPGCFSVVTIQTSDNVDGTRRLGKRGITVSSVNSADNRLKPTGVLISRNLGPRGSMGVLVLNSTRLRTLGGTSIGT